MKTVTLKSGSEQGVFQRGKTLARLADTGKAIPEECTISFEDPTELVRLLTASRLDVFRCVKKAPGSITMVAERLHQDRSAVKRDVDQLAQAGLVTIETKVLPGHGLMKEVRAAANRFRLEAMVV